jgi:ribosomal protein S18 acetylase RimI-like enzyme
VTAPLPPPFRRGTPADAEALVDFISYASEGLAPYFWEMLAPPGVSARDYAIRRVLDPQQPITTATLIVGEDEARAVCGLVDFDIPDPAPPVDRQKLPAIIVPIKELEAEAAGTWYINILAAYPENRNRGWGSQLIELARRRATVAGRRHLTLVASNGNHGALRLYARHGFVQVGERPLIREGWRTESTRWLLLRAAL